jgi:hypothetical protein
MERKIGDRFEWWGKTLEVVEAVENFPAFNICDNCCFNAEVCHELKKIRGECIAENRADNKDVYFIEIKEDVMTSDDYLKAHRNSGIEVGDTVKVLRRATEGEQGWNNKWCTDMDSFIGKEFEVFEDDGVFGFSIEVGVSEYNFPWFVLEITRKKDQCPINIDDLYFGYVNKERVKKILTKALVDKDFDGAVVSCLACLDDGYDAVGADAIQLIKNMTDADITNKEFDTIKEVVVRLLNYLREAKNENK